MGIEVYIKSVGIGMGIWLLSAFPVVLAAIVTQVPGSKIQRKILFSIVSGVMAYGLAVLTYICFVPFILMATYYAPQWYADGYETLARSVTFLSEVGDVIPLIVLLVVSFLIPILGRKNYWNTFIETLANKQRNSDSGADAPPPVR
jgi:hypothetical protein